jgi:hypothetical protein
VATLLRTPLLQPLFQLLLRFVRFVRFYCDFSLLTPHYYSYCFDHGFYFKVDCRISTTRSLANISIAHSESSMSMAPMYSSLDIARREIRVINLQPGSWDDEIICTLQVVALDDAPTYTTLSYVWGDRPRTIQ